MNRYEMSASQWRKIEGSLPGRAGWVGVTANDNRYIEHRGVMDAAQSRSLETPACRVWKLEECTQAFYALGQDYGSGSESSGCCWRIPKNTYIMIDSTIVRAHQQAVCGKGGGQGQALGRSRGGLSTKIHMRG